MGLSEYDKKVLEQLERDLLGADDSLSRKFTAGKAKTTNSAAKVIAGALVAVVGMSLVVFGAISHLIAFGVAGFLIALTGILVASANPVARTTVGSKKPPAKNSGTFFENRWDKRRDRG